MPEYKNCTRISVTLNNEILAELDRRAEALACPRSVYIATALKQKWQTEDNMANMPVMLATLGNAVRVIDELKADPALLEKAKSDPRLIAEFADKPTE